MREMAKTKVIPVRMDDNMQKRVENAGLKLGSTSSGIIRLGILAVLPMIESGKILLPPSRPELSEENK